MGNLAGPRQREQDLVGVARGGKRHVGAGDPVRGAEPAAGERQCADNRDEMMETPETTGHSDLAAEGMGAADTAGFMPPRLAATTGEIISIY